MHKNFKGPRAPFLFVVRIIKNVVTLSYVRCGSRSAEDAAYGSLRVTQRPRSTVTKISSN